MVKNFRLGKKGVGKIWVSEMGTPHLIALSLSLSLSLSVWTIICHDWQTAKPSSISQVWMTFKIFTHLTPPRRFLSVNGKTSAWPITAKRHDLSCFSLKFYRSPTKKTTTQRRFVCQDLHTPGKVYSITLRPISFITLAIFKFICWFPVCKKSIIVQQVTRPPPTWSWYLLHYYWFFIDWEPAFNSKMVNNTVLYTTTCQKLILYLRRFTMGMGSYMTHPKLRTP